MTARHIATIIAVLGAGLAVAVGVTQQPDLARDAAVNVLGQFAPAGAYQ